MYIGVQTLMIQALSSVLMDGMRIGESEALDILGMRIQSDVLITFFRDQMMHSSVMYIRPKNSYKSYIWKAFQCQFWSFMTRFRKRH